MGVSGWRRQHVDVGTRERAAAARPRLRPPASRLGTAGRVSGSIDYLSRSVIRVTTLESFGYPSQARQSSRLPSESIIRGVAAVEPLRPPHARLGTQRAGRSPSARAERPLQPPSGRLGNRSRPAAAHPNPPLAPQRPAPGPAR